ncbi:zinc-ribbon domain-containing protein [Anaeromyxobacter terrae]|uniref:zinc-ribbon domain-containing protein n=1 Tax=Anaeromyxobacter terrae TaxID=2925406 RepID=UPI001F5AF80D|nr:zinc-ribbon domain-containing protein [Anaeromyxobacter sp. SG22]
MVIRCERCSTLYELDETLLAPDGSPVQCTRCDHVFTARPPAPEAAETRAASVGPALTPAELELAVAPASGATLDPPTPDSVAAGAVPPPSSRAESSGPRAPAQDPRYARGTSPAVYRPTPGPTSVRAHPVLRRDTVGAFESRLRWSARLRWLVPAVALGLVVLAAGGFFLLRGRVAPGAAGARAEGLALLALDDTHSLDEAVARLDDALRRAPRLHAAIADRALVQAMQATAVAERSRALAAARGARQVERERLLREQPPGWEEAERAASGAASKLEAEVRALDERARSLVASARSALTPLEAELRGDPALVRALAAVHLAAGERAAALALARTAGTADDRDPWIELVDAALDATEAHRAAQERAVVKLTALSARSPELLRARHLLAVTQAALGRTDEARGTLDRLLAANPRHESARALRDSLSTRPPAASPGESPPGNVTPPARKTIAQRPPAATPGPATPAPPDGASGAQAPVPPQAGASPAAPSLGGAPATARGLAPSALMPASIPDVAPTSGMPQIAPPGASDGSRHPAREPALHEESVGGG